MILLKMKPHCLLIHYNFLYSYQNIFHKKWSKQVNKNIYKNQANIEWLNQSNTKIVNIIVRMEFASSLHNNRHIMKQYTIGILVMFVNILNCLCYLCYYVEWCNYHPYYLVCILCDTSHFYINLASFLENIFSYL